MIVQSPILISDEHTTYTIEVIDTNGCVAVEEVEVRFNSSTVYLPTVIARNSRIAMNGSLFLSGNQLGTYSLEVYDRWGNLIFDQNKLTMNAPSEGWIPASNYTSGVYVYVIRYKEKGIDQLIVGDITLL